MMMVRETLEDRLNRHKEWLSSAKKRGERFIFGGEYHGTLFAGANLRDAVLSGAHLDCADIRDANLESAQLEDTNLGRSVLRGANLRGANLRNANLKFALLNGADLTDADLSGADLSGANLISVSFTGTKGLISTKEYLDKTFEKTPEGYIVYKVFGYKRRPDPEWEITPGSVIRDCKCDYDRRIDCGSGINVATCMIVQNMSVCPLTILPTPLPIWKCLIRYEWVNEHVCVPYATDGRIRCGMLQLIEIID